MPHSASNIFDIRSKKSDIFGMDSQNCKPNSKIKFLRVKMFK